MLMTLYYPKSKWEKMEKPTIFAIVLIGKLVVFSNSFALFNFSSD